MAGGNPTCTCMYSRARVRAQKYCTYCLLGRSPSPSTGTGLEIAPHMDSGEGRGVEPVSSALEISSRLTLLPSDQSCPNLCALRSTAFPLGCPQARLCSFEVNGTKGSRKNNNYLYPWMFLSVIQREEPQSYATTSCSCSCSCS